MINAEIVLIELVQSISDALNVTWLLILPDKPFVSKTIQLHAVAGGTPDVEILLQEQGPPVYDGFVE